MSYIIVLIIGAFVVMCVACLAISAKDADDRAKYNDGADIENNSTNK